MVPSVGTTLELITEQEALLPADTIVTRGITRGPRVTVIWPAPNAGTIKSPLRLQIAFQSRGGHKVEPDSVIVTYMKLPPIDLTERVRSYIHDGGIDIDDAVVPPGHHRIRIEVMDTSGRSGTADFTFDVR
jgi:hypothetical protein